MPYRVNPITGKLDYYEAGGGGSVSSVNNPTINSNLPLGTLWVNIISGEVFVCKDATVDNNRWQGQCGTIIQPSTAGILDFFGDSSCVALYQLDGNANDTSGVYNGTPTDITYTSGRFGQAAIFNGSSSKIETALSTTGTTTYSAWLNLSSTQVNYAGLFKQSINNIYSGIYITQEANKYPSIIISTGGNNFIETIFSASNWSAFIGNWALFTFVLDGTTAKFFINGVLKEAKTLGGSLFLEQMVIGVYAASSRYLNGLVDQIRIFNRALTDAEVLQLYTGEV